MIIKLRPQPLGIFPLPVGYLLLPDSAESLTLQPLLLQGRYPHQWPAALAFYGQALAGNIPAAYARLATDDTPLAAYNRFVLQADPATYRQLRQTLPAPLATLLDVVAYTLGYLSTPPAADGLDGELLAFVLMAQATAALERQEPLAALGLLEQAYQAAVAVSPIYAAQLLGTLAEMREQAQGLSPGVLQQYRQAIQQLEQSDLTLVRAELALHLGICYQELANGQRGALMEAVRYYQEALQGFRRETEPDYYALAHNNLALAYLALPMTEASDQLRMGIAVQSLREALKVYTKEHHPQRWASAQLNLANALQYLPSSHPQDNLVEAVERYEEILTLRTQASDPLGYARLLANQGNALAHLGIRDHATAKLTTAQAIFAQYGENDAATSVGALLAQLEQA